MFDIAALGNVSSKPHKCRKHGWADRSLDIEMLYEIMRDVLIEDSRAEAKQITEHIIKSYDASIYI